MHVVIVVHIASDIAQRVGQSFALPFLVLMLALMLGPWVATRLRLPATVGFVAGGMLVSRTIENGIRDLASSEEATLVVIDWKRARLDEDVVQFAGRAHAHVVLAHHATYPTERVVLVACGGPDLAFAMTIVERIAEDHHVTCIRPPGVSLPAIAAAKTMVTVDARDPLGWFRENVPPTELAVLPGLAAARAAMAAVEDFTDRRVLVAIG